MGEGVENAEQLAFLREHQCCEAQGYYFSRPVSADALTALLRSNIAMADFPGAR